QVKPFKAQGEESSWIAAVLNSVIYTVVNIVLLILGFVPAINARLRELSITQDPADLETFYRWLGFNNADQTAVALASLGFGISISIGVALAVTVVLLIHCLIIHVFARVMLSGQGSYLNLIAKTMLPLAIGYPLVVVVAFGLSALAEANPALLTFNLVAQFALTFVMSFVFANRVGAAYRFGFMPGCGAVLLSWVVLIPVLCCTIGIGIPLLFTSVFAPGGAS
ncbi:MAG: hypothetical protein H7Y11_06215, partial [Armatimonadetes bacterium]|nr:hypothetical protein [Anaerolineae bacterium]